MGRVNSGLLGPVSVEFVEKACRENISFMALSANTKLHFTTIAGFIFSLGKEIAQLFLHVLLVCDEQGLIGKQIN